MNSRLIVSAIAATTLCAGALPAASQGRVYDRNASNNPEIYMQTHPEDAANAGNLQGLPGRIERHDRSRPDAARQEQARREEQRRREADHQHRRDAEHHRHDHDRRHWDRRSQDHRYYGYVTPRPFYYNYSAPTLIYSAPPVYSSPPVYFGAAPQTYYPPVYNSAPVVFRAGDYLPLEYRGAQYLVTDWQWRGLSAPPFGYQWFLLGPSHFALVANSTGQIVSLVAAR